MNVRRTENARLIRYLETMNDRPGAHDLRRPNERELRQFAVYGTHPEVVERVWAQLGAGVPVECRQLVMGRPALLTGAGIVFAVAIGTSYVIQVPRRVKWWRGGLPIEIEWSDRSPLNVKATLGKDWLVGDWSEHELKWCVAAYQYFEDTER